MLSIVCKHVSTGSKIYSTIEQRTASVLTTNDFCKILNSKMSTLLGKDNTFNHFDIIYVDDGENNIDKKFPEDSAIPFISRLPSSSLTYNLTLAFYARDKIPSIPTIPYRSNSSTAPNNSAAICAYSCEYLASLNTFETCKTTCCVCYTETTISCNDYFNCGNNKHFICNSCYEKTRSQCTSHRCPVCRAPPYSEFLSIN